ncbi:Os07g0534600, partial [Oryza sativa Japonica Group]
HVVGDLEEWILLVPEVAAHAEDPAADAAAEPLGHLVDDTGEAAPALRRRQVRRALRDGVHGHRLRREPGLPRGVPPGRVARPVGHRVHQLRHQRVERRDVARVGDVVHVERGRLRLVGGAGAGAGEEVLVRVPELVLVVVDGDVLAVQAAARRLLERRRQPRGGAVVPGEVAAAEQEAVRRVRRRAERPRRVARRRGVPGQHGEEAVEIGLERAVRQVRPPGRRRVTEGGDRVEHRQGAPAVAGHRRRRRDGGGGGEEEQEDKHGRLLTENTWELGPG